MYYKHNYGHLTDKCAQDFLKGRREVSTIVHAWLVLRSEFCQVQTYKLLGTQESHIAKLTSGGVDQAVALSNNQTGHFNQTVVIMSFPNGPILIRAGRATSTILMLHVVERDEFFIIQLTASNSVDFRMPVAMCCIDWLIDPLIDCLIVCLTD